MFTTRWRRSLATRVTMIATTAAAAALLVLLTGLFFVVTRQLDAATDRGLQARSRDLQAALAAGDVRAVDAEPYAQSGEGATAQVSKSLQGAAALVPEPTKVPVGSGQLFNRDFALPSANRDKVLLRVLVRRLPDGQLLAVGVSRRPQEEAAERLLAGLAVAGPLLLLLVAGVVNRAVRAALQPVETLVREARLISAAEDTGRRLPVVPGDDEIAHLAKTLDDMLARLALAFERERAFVDDASHELRTPLAVLRGEIELALSDLDDRAGVEQSLRAALDEAERLSRLADDLLLLARDRSGGLALRTERVDLLALLTATATRLAPTTGLTLPVDCPELWLLSDPDRLEQALTNLVSNAAAAGAGTAVLSARHDPARGQVLLSVEDDGPGFPPGFADLAFGRFTRADPARTRGSGAGLGLSLVAAIARAAGGTVAAGNDSA